MKTNQLIPLVLIVLLAGSITYYTLDFDDRDSVQIIVDKDDMLDIDREVQAAI